MNPLLEELKGTSVLLKTHWDETRTKWDDCVRDRVEKNYIDAFRDTILLCLKGQCGSTYVYGRGLIELFKYMEMTAKQLSQYSGIESKIDAMGVQEQTIRYPNEERHKRPYTDEDDEDKMVNYDDYPEPR